MKKKWIVIISVAVLLAGIVGYGAVRLARAMNGDVALTGEDAKAVALEHAGLTVGEATFDRTEYEVDDGRPEYEIEFRSGNTEYDYTIHAETGKVLEWDRDHEPARTSPAKPATPTEPEKLTKAQAEAIALEHAGLTAEQVKGLRSEYDMDDGVPEYSVEFRADGWEYDYEIHAETGKILSRERDD